jgi:hypothetical protein
MHFDAAAVLRCDPPSLWLVELSCPEAADALIFSCGHSQGRFGAGAPRAARLPHQLFLHVCMESTGGRADRGFLAAMDLVATFQTDSDVPLLYLPGNLSLFAPPPPPAPPRDGLTMFVISHCGLERDLYLRQLMQHCSTCRPATPPPLPAPPRREQAHATHADPPPHTPNSKGTATRACGPTAHGGGRAEYSGGAGAGPVDSYGKCLSSPISPLATLCRWTRTASACATRASPRRRAGPGGGTRGRRWCR